MPALISFCRSSLVFVLSTLLVELPVASALTEAVPTPATPTSALRTARTSHAPLSQQERILHVLDRLTFGPRPGDVAAVQAMGLDRWLNQQLTPSTIDDSALDARLNAYPAMRLPQAQLVARFPDNGVIRAAAAGNLSLPAEPDLRAVYRHSIALYQDRQARKAAGQPEDTAAAMEASAQAGKVAADTVSAIARGPRRVSLLGADELLSNTFSLKARPLPADRNGSDVALPGQRPRSFHAEALYPQAATTAILALPPAARVTRLLSLSPTDLVALRRSLSSDELRQLALGLSPEQKETLAELQNPTNVVTAELMASRLERDIYSDRQLEAVMTDFWLNHFNVYVHKNQNEPLLLPAYERETIRPHALGHFENLLVATTSSPAMLVYLDNAQSIGPHSLAAERASRNAKAATGAERGLNENYARELMELHTLGVRCEASKDHAPTDPTCGKGYTQADVTEVARVLSGWTVDRPAAGSLAIYDERRHEPGTKHVLGTAIHQNGEREGLQLLHLLATSPATARFLSTKLAVRFVSDTPPPALVDRMTKSWIESNGDIRTVLLTMVHSPEFFAPAAYRAKVKTPLEFMVSALRASGAEVSNPAALVQSMNRLGMPLYGMQTPNGYSWLSEPWVSTAALVTRMNFALILADNRLPGTHITWPKATSSGGGAAQSLAAEPTPLPAERALELTLFSEPISDRTRTAILAQADTPDLPAQARHQLFTGDGIASAATTQPATPTVSAEGQTAIMAGLLLGSPEFQRR